MKKKNNITSLLNRSGNLTIEVIERYLSGHLSKSESDVVKKHLEASPFDREALEGMQKHDLKDIAGEVNMLNKQILKSDKKPGSEERIRINFKTYWYAAAGVILIAGLSFILLFLINDRPLQNQLAVNKPSAVDEEGQGGVQPVPDPSGNQSDIIPVTEQNTRIIAPVQAQPETKKVTVINDDVVIGEQLIVDTKVDAEVSEEQEMLAFEDMEEEEESQIFMVVEQMPEFPGGEEKLYQFLADSIHYPQLAKDSGIQGRVYVTFVIENDGSVSDARILRGIGGGCDEEALRVINLMPKWKPGTERGKSVRVQYSLPVKFTLQ